MGANTEELYPVLVAELADEESCAVLRAAANRRGVLVVPLLSAPVDRRPHLLEVYVRGGATEVFVAEPAGAPTDAGFPLRIEPFGQPVDTERGAPHDTEPPAAHDTEPPSILRTASRTKPTLSQQHARELAAGTEPLSAYVGRHLARGKYRLDALVGAGGMGAVYRGYHRDLDREVAVKILHPRFRDDPDFSKRFHAEAQTMSRIDHPNVTRVLDFGEEDDGLLYLAMEFLDGIDLQTLLRRDGALELERLVKVMVQVTAGLGHVHRHAIIHRDVKPRNIVIIAGLDEDHETPIEIVKVCDFGIALVSGEAEASAGTPAYMSPEQVEGGPVDARSDVYAAGVLMYQLATGELPFTGGGSTEIRRSHIVEAPAPPSRHVASLDPLLETIIMKALSKPPELRQQSMRELRAELRELLAPAVVALDPGSDQALSVSMLPDVLPSLPPLSTLGPPPPMPPNSVMPPLPPAPELDRPQKPPAPPERAQSSSEPDLDRWLENRNDAYASFLAYAAATDREIDEAWLAQLAATRDLASFKEGVKALDGPVGKLLQAGNAPGLAAVIVTMRAIIKEDPTAPRAKYAGRILRLLRDPPRLVPFVDAALGAATDPSPALQRILLETQGAGADALCAGRRRHGSAAARVRFVRMMRALGPAALPALAATLRDCLAHGLRAGDVVEDLLAALPPVADENAGSAVAELLRGGPVVGTTSAALTALATLWGERARPLLFGALGHPHPSVAIAAIAGLRALRAVDERVVRRLEAVATGILAAPDELRIAAITALGEALPEAREEAGKLVIRASDGERGGGGPAFAAALQRAGAALGVVRAGR